MNTMGYLGQSTIEGQLANFKAKYQEFTSAYTRLISAKPSQSSASYSQWLTLKNRGDALDKMLKGALGSALQAAAALKSTFGDATLGAAWVIPAAIVALGGLIAYTTVYITDALSFAQNEGARRAEALKVSAAAMLKSGTITQAEYDARIAAIYSSQPPVPGILGDTASIIKWVAIGGAIFILAPQLMKLFGSRK